MGNGKNCNNLKVNDKITKYSFVRDKFIRKVNKPAINIAKQINKLEQT